MITYSNETANGNGDRREILPEALADIAERPESWLSAQNRKAILKKVRYAWRRRARLLRFAFAGLLISTLVAFLIPKEFEAVTRLMPPEQSLTSSMAAAALLNEKIESGSSAIAGDLLSTRSSGSLFIGILHSSTVADRLIAQFQLGRVYRTKYQADTRNALAAHAEINEDKHSGIISIEVTDRDPGRAAALAAAYVEQLNNLVTELNSGSAHRERVFLEDRL